MEYIDFDGQAGSHEASAPAGHQPVQQYASAANAYTPDPASASYMNANFPAHISCDIKPRLTKEQADVLESHYQKQPKPNTNIKKGFAETLNVSLDKVNNWFQNRRAKSKQEVKKQNGNAASLQQHASPDDQTSPGFVNPTSTYHAAMQQWAIDQRTTHGLGISAVQHTQQQQQLQDLVLQSSNAEPEHLQSYLAPVQFSQNGYHDQDEFHRRTLTQEQFNAMERNGGLVDQYGHFQDFESSFSGNHDVLSSVFPEFDDFKPQEVFAYPIGAPLSSYDSTIPSNISEQSLSAFPSSASMQAHANVSPTSDWTDSRSSSVHEGAAPVPVQHQRTVSSSQWQPGQSVPVDPAAQHAHFRRIEAQAAAARSSPHLPMSAPAVPWSDEALARRASTTSLLAQSMSNVGIQTPPLHQAATFKSPAPPANIAARRQRPRPAQLGVAALRSQSHSGTIQTGPLPMPPQHSNASELSLRRIRSSNFLGAIAPGRVMKSTPPAPRSPMPYTLNNAVNSQHAIRHMPSGTLAPPTPMSPNVSTAEPSGQIQHWPVQAAMNEEGGEHVLHYFSANAATVHGRSSPPSSPPSYHHQYVPSHVHGGIILENTPPQSAPASQTCFPANAYMHHPVHQPVPSHPLPPHHPTTHSNPHYTPDHSYNTSNVIFTPIQHANITTTGPPPGVPLHFANGVPITNANGNIELVFPPQLQFVPQQPTPTPSHMHTPPQMSYPFATSSPAMQKPADFFVHEYTPPESVKRSATPRKGPIDLVPRNYAFANTGPEHFEEKREEKKPKRVDSKDENLAGTSPEGSTVTV